MEPLNYNKIVMKHFRHPKFMGKIEDADAIGEAGNSACGDVMKVYLKIGKSRKNEKIIKDIKFQTFGCVAAIASTDALCSIAKGKTLKEAGKIKKSDIMKKLNNLPKIKVHCSVLGEETLKNALENYKKKKSYKNL